VCVVATTVAVGGSRAATDAGARSSTNPPDAIDDTLATDEDTAGVVDVLGNDRTAPRGAPLSVTASTDGAHGTASCTPAGACTYTPAADFSGADSFTYTITDGALGDTATVHVTVNPVNDAPQALDDELATNQDTPGAVNVLANDSDPEGDALTVTTPAPTAQHGTVVCASSGSCTYTPASGFSGSDAFDYGLGDGNGGSDTGRVTVTVNALVAPPAPPPPPPPPPPAPPEPPQPESADVTVTITQEVLAPASVEGSAVSRGTRVRYSITVTNNGPGVARSVFLEQHPPGGASFDFVSTDTGSCSGSTTVSCAFGNLSSGQQAHVTTIATVAQDGTATSTASVRATGPDPREANNTASASLDVTAAPRQVDPVFGQAVSPVVVSGFVCVRLPGSNECVDVTTLAQIPVGSIVDTRVGRVALTVATVAGTTESAELYEGEFRVLQSTGATEFRLTGGDFSVCTVRPAKAKAKKAKKRKPAGLEAITAAKPRKPIRRLWGDSKGSFRTGGRYGAATVRGTVWLTEDYCNGTLIRVREGAVSVRDLVRNTTVTVTAGKSYFAEAPAPKAAKAKAKKTKKRKPSGGR
jgi:uncharacterized repeat protein (TIGR01451 family)